MNQISDIDEPQQNVLVRQQREWDAMVDHLANLRHLLKAEELKNAQHRERIKLLESQLDGRAAAAEAKARVWPTVRFIEATPLKPELEVLPPKPAPIAEAPKSTRAPRGQAKKGLSSGLRAYLRDKGEATLEMIARDLKRTPGSVGVSLSHGRLEIAKRRANGRMFYRLAT